MSVKVESTTDSNEAVTAALGDLAKKEETVVPPATEKPVESKEASGASEEEQEEAESGEEKKASEEKGDEEGKPKKKNGFKKRIEKLNKRIADKEGEIAYWRNEAQRGRGTQEPQQKTETKTAQADGRPKADTFEDHDQYLEALADWKADQKIQAAETKRRQTEVKSEYDGKIQKFQKEVKEFSSKHDDFNDVMEDVNDIPMSPTVQQAILESDNGPELAYELAKNRDLYDKICKMGPIQAMREIGRFEAKLQKAEEVPQSTTKKTTEAPKPLKTVGSKSPATTKSLDEMDYQEFKRAREAQLRAS
jgi:hypothetical protein